MLSGAPIPLRVLLLRSTRKDYLAFTWRHFLFGIAITWVVGMGRYWDNPRVGMLQHLGIGSVVYAFILSALLWAVVWPFRETMWTYPQVLTLVVLTSPPAAIYALPVEKWLSPTDAGQANLLFVVLVSTWRMGIWWRFVLMMTPPGTPVATVVFLPVILIISVLSYLNLEHAVVWQLMGGIQEKPTPADTAYNVVGLIASLSGFLVLPFLLIGYLASYLQLRKSRTAQSALLDTVRAVSDRRDNDVT